MSSSIDDLITHMHAVHSFIGLQMEAAPAVAHTIITSQTAQLTARLQMLSVSVQQAHQLSEIVNSGPWPATSKNALHDVIASRIGSVQAPAVTRRTNQNFRYLQNFVNQSRLNALKNCTPNVAAETAVNILNDLQCTNPTEQSWGYIVAALVLLTGLPQDEMSMFKIVTECKRLMNRQRVSVPLASHVINVPNTYDELPIALQNAAFSGDNIPVNTGVKQDVAL
jgi:hypothetical protein